MIPLDGKPTRLRPITADVEKQQAVVEAFRVSSSPPLQDSGSDLHHIYRGLLACLVGVWYVSAFALSRDGSMDGSELTWSERDAMGCDNYHPVAKRGSNLTRDGGIGYTVLDVVDSLILLGLDEEYQRAREWVANKLSFDRDGIYNTFEVSPPFRKHKNGRTMFHLV